jgi:hypothetical protein
MFFISWFMVITYFICQVKAQFTVSVTLHNLDCFPCCVIQLHHTFQIVVFWLLQLQSWNCTSKLY